jgi:hypothetical protein
MQEQGTVCGTAGTLQECRNSMQEHFRSAGTLYRNNMQNCRNALQEHCMAAGTLCKNNM